MTGLLQKDFSMLKQRKQTFFLFLMIALIMGMSSDGSFVVGYCTMLIVIMTISTISYDELDNCFPFLLTLPVTRKTYVDEKYTFCIAGGIAGWFLSVILFLICNALKGGLAAVSGQLAEMMVFIPVFLMIIAIMLPIELKYGAEKSRVVLAMIGGGAVAIGFIGKKFLPEETPAVIMHLDQISAVNMLGIAFVIGLSVLALSYLCSRKIMTGKQF